MSNTISTGSVDRRGFLRSASGIALGATAALGAAAQDSGSGAAAAAGSPQFSLAHLTVLGCAPPEMIYIAARAGYDFVSLRPIYMGLAGEANYALAENQEMLRQTKTALNDTGVKVHDIELARIIDDVDVASYAPAFEVSAELGARHVISSIWTPRRDYAIDQFGALCDVADEYGLTVNLEFVSWADVANLQQSIDVLKAVDRENVGILVDTLHLNRSRVELDELDSVPREWFNFMHICDAPPEIPTTREGLIFTGRDERLDPGTGGIDIAAIVDRIPVVPYSLEIPHLARVAEMGYAEHAHRCLEAAKRYFAAHPHS